MMLLMGKFIDLTGSVFNRWTVIGRGDGSRWICRCSCGSERQVEGGSLRRGVSKSCGCLLAERAAETRLNDLIGNRYGLLTVIRRGENSRHGDAQWICRCDCGAESTVRSCNLVSGTTGSCGCARKNGIVVRPERVRLKAALKAAERYRKDAKFNLRARMATAIRTSLRRKDSQRKAGRWESLVGYTVENLWCRLSDTIPDGYTWDDYLKGDLEIDHIVPLDAFNYGTVSDFDFKRAWALNNLQLLPTSENQKKSNKLAGKFQPSLRF